MDEWMIVCMQLGHWFYSATTIAQWARCTSWLYKRPHLTYNFFREKKKKQKKKKKKKKQKKR